MDLDISDIERFSESSSSENQDYGVKACSILSSLEDTLGRIDDFLSFERVFIQGDLVCLVQDEPSGQTGRVVNVDMIVDVEDIFGTKIRGVNSKKIQKIRSIMVGDYVVCGPWLGKVEKVIDRITVLFDDGFMSEFTTTGHEIITPISPDLLEDPHYPFYPGQRVRIHTRPVPPKSTKWLCYVTDVRNDKRYTGTVCSLDAGVVYVSWIGCVTNGREEASSPPHLQDSKNLTLLSCYSDAKWQVGDWCLLLDADDENSLHSSLWKRSQKVKKLVVIVRTKAKVDVQWQDGNTTFGLDADSLSPVNVVDSHDFWPDQFVLQKDICDDSGSPSLHRCGVVKCLDAKERTVTVKWTNFHSKELNNFDKEETVSAYELMDHPDYSFSLGNAVFRYCLGKSQTSQTWQESSNNLMHLSGDEMDQNSDYSSSIGIIVGFEDGNIKVNWANGSMGIVAPYELYCIDKYEDASMAIIPYGENLEQQNAGVNLHGGKQLSMPKGKDPVDFDGDGEICKKKLPLAMGSNSFSHAAIALFSSISSVLFSISLFGGYHHISQEGRRPEMLGKEPEGEKSEKVMEKKDDYQLKRDVGPLTCSKLPPESFSQFDIVNGCSDHHFVNTTGKDVTSSLVKKGWVKRVQEEWNILQHDLPGGIYVCVYEERMDLLRAAIVGAPGTPYHDGMFFFDFCFPPEYPNEPPMVYYNSGGLRVNPNLYESGKVCLSLLNTWTGSENEVWNPKCSTALQVLLSLQALVLNEKPYFNEAGYDTQIGKAGGEKSSVNYNENAYLVTCKSMLYLLRNQPKHFEALVKEHFSRRGKHILLACKAYMDDTPVGAAGCGHLKSDQEHFKGSSKGFKILLAKIFPRLVEAFSENVLVPADS
ncbi:unnamed protein product [Cuscuta europaea]|uniref:E2 ubiquitin-conjugating enzyme n=1 Tax=Cuscuta europaea TaxID=41803 RepID=A0A9P1EKI2_CUSEU|nr:unnamed protein product [Cuscuta europaea]